METPANSETDTLKQPPATTVQEIAVATEIMTRDEPKKCCKPAKDAGCHIMCCVKTWSCCLNSCECTCTGMSNVCLFFSAVCTGFNKCLEQMDCDGH